MNELKKFIINNISELGYLKFAPDYMAQDKGKMGLIDNIPYVTEQNFKDLKNYFSRGNAFEIKEDTTIINNGKELFLPKGYFAISAGNVFLGVVDADTFNKLFTIETPHFSSIKEIIDKVFRMEDQFLEAYKLNGFDGMKELCELYKLNEYHLDKIKKFIDSQANEEDLFKIFFDCSNYLENRRDYQKIEEKLSIKYFFKIYSILSEAMKEKDNFGCNLLVNKFMKISMFNDKQIELLTKALDNKYLTKENIETVLESLEPIYFSNRTKELQNVTVEFLDYCIDNNVSTNTMKLGKRIIECIEDLQLAKNLPNDISNHQLLQAQNLIASVANFIEEPHDKLVLKEMFNSIFSDKLSKLDYNNIEDICKSSLNIFDDYSLPREKFYINYIVNLYTDSKLSMINGTLDDLLAQGGSKEVDINVSTMLQLLDYASDKCDNINSFIKTFCKVTDENIQKSNICGSKSSNGKIYVDNDGKSINIYVKKAGIFGKYTKYELDKFKLDKLKINKIYIDCFYKQENQRNIDKYI